MTISDTDKIDLLYKRIVYGMAKTADANSKTGANETIVSPMPVFNQDIWTEASAIPATPPTAETNIVMPYVGAKAIKLVADVTSPVDMAWTTTIKGFIRPSFGAAYCARVWIGDPATTGCARLYPDTAGEEWILDGMGGVLLFPNTTPKSKKAIDGTTVNLADVGLYLEGYEYIGARGFPEAPVGPKKAIDVVAGTVGATSVGTLLDGAVIASIAVDVTEAFEAGATLVVGNGSAGDFYMGADMSDLSDVGTYVILPPVSHDDPQVVVTLAGSSRMGTATVRFVYA